MSSGDTVTRDEGSTVVPRWKEVDSSLDSFEERVKLYVMGMKREDRWSTATGGSRGTAVQGDSGRDHQCTARRRWWRFILSAAALGTKPIQEAVRRFRQLMGHRGVRRETGEHAKVDHSR